MKAAVKRAEEGRYSNPLVEIRRLLKPADEELALLLRTATRTVYRWLEDGPPAEHPVLTQLQELLALAQSVMKSDEISTWFHEPNRALGGFIPIRLILDPQGYLIVRDELGAAAHGLPL